MTRLESYDLNCTGVICLICPIKQRFEAIFTRNANRFTRSLRLCKRYGYAIATDLDCYDYASATVMQTLRMLDRYDYATLRLRDRYGYANVTDARPL